MTEGYWTRAVLKSLREALPLAVFEKRNDRVAGGRPDVLVLVNGYYEQWEMKVARTEITAFDVLLSPKQRHYCNQLHHAGAVVRGYLLRPKGTVERWVLATDGWYHDQSYRNWRSFVNTVAVDLSQA